MRRMFYSLFVALLLIAVPAGAQTLGTITGDVKDSSGALIPGATVTATNTGTNAARESVSNDSGAYSFPALPPGPYIVKAELQGFRTVTQAVQLQIEATVRVNFTMEIGTLSEVTEVTGVASFITTENATVGTVIENRRIVELPLNGRNFLSLIALSPNVSAEFAGAGQAGDRQGGSRANQQISISGQRREFNYYTLDGTDNTDVNFNTYILLPSIDALEEFKVQTGIYSAEFGRAASQVNVVTKSAGLTRTCKLGTDVRTQGNELEIIPAIERELHNAPVFDHGADGCIRSFDQRRTPHHRRHFGDRAQFQREVDARDLLHP